MASISGLMQQRGLESMELAAQLGVDVCCDIANKMYANEFNCIERAALSPIVRVVPALLPKISKPETSFAVSVLAHVGTRLAMFVQAITACVMLPFETLYFCFKVLRMLCGGDDVDGLIKSFISYVTFSAIVPISIIGMFAPFTAIDHLGSLTRKLGSFIYGSELHKDDEKLIKETREAVNKHGDEKLGKALEEAMNKRAEIFKEAAAGAMKKAIQTAMREAQTMAGNNAPYNPSHQGTPVPDALVMQAYATAAQDLRRQGAINF